jgi:hypothetical protein
MGCCTSLLYGSIGASKNTVKERLTLILRLLDTPTVSATVDGLRISLSLCRFE